MFSPSLILGFSTGLSLIVAIGAQNAFVLRQGIRREHVLMTVLVCIISDLVLIVAGIAGMGAIMERFPDLLTVARFGGAVFLLSYAFLALKRALKPQALQTTTGTTATSMLSVASIALALTWLNPHVYVDTVLLLGSIGSAQGDGATAFAAGAMLASILWFAALGYAARFLSGVFATPRAWRILDSVIALLMTLFAVFLIVPVFTT